MRPLERRLLAPHLDCTALRRELDLPDGYPQDAEAELDDALRGGYRAANGGADADRQSRADRTDIPFMTLDPPGSSDLDQAFCVTRRPGRGYRVHYAIADLAAFIRPGGALDTETWRRGRTIYLPDGDVPLHPPALGGDAASLLPDRTRPALIWTIDLDPYGEATELRVERAAVRSRARLDHASVQADVAAARAPEPVTLLMEVGELLAARARRRGAIDLPIPAQEIVPDGEGWRLVLRRQCRVELCAAQLSLLTGVAAARIMLDGGVGLLRTAPGPRPEAVARLRSVAGALGIDWPDGVAAGTVLASLDPVRPAVAALLDQAVELLHGAEYTAFRDTPPDRCGHGVLAAPYAQVTAPLRRLSDRYAAETCLALYSGRCVPEWVLLGLPRLPAVMAAAGRVAGAAERGAVNLAEAVLLCGRVGDTFRATVVDVNARGTAATVTLEDPPVRARCRGTGLALGARVTVALQEVDPVRRRVRFRVASGGMPPPTAGPT